MKQNIALKDKKKIRKQINGKFNHMGSADENIYIYQCSNFFICQKLKFRVPFSQLKPILGFSLSSCPQHSLSPAWRLKYVFNCEQNFSFCPYSDPDYPTSGLTVIGLARVYCVCTIQYITKYNEYDEHMKKHVPDIKLQFLRFTHDNEPPGSTVSGEFD
jgi:hypothetical protein